MIIDLECEFRMTDFKAPVFDGKEERFCQSINVEQKTFIRVSVTEGEDGKLSVDTDEAGNVISTVVPFLTCTMVNNTDPKLKMVIS